MSRTEQNRTVREHTCSRTGYPYTATEQNRTEHEHELVREHREQPAGVEKNGRDVDSLDISYTKVRHHKENISVDLRDVSTPVLAFFCVKNQHILEAVLGHFTSLCATVRSERTRTNCSRTRVFANEVPCRRRKSEQNRTEHEQRTVREQCSRTRTEHRPLTTKQVVACRSVCDVATRRVSQEHGP